MTTPLEQIEQHLAKQLLSPKGWEQYQQGNVSKAELQAFVESVQNLSQAYTHHTVGRKLVGGVADEAAAAAYALYYLPINAAKVLHLSPLLPLTRRSLRVLDFGAGPGTVALSLLASCNAQLDITCVEHSAGMRAVARTLISSWEGQTERVRASYCAQLPQDSQPPYDLVCAANALAELDESVMQSTINSLITLLAPGGTLLLLEPGQRLHTRRLMSVRNSLLAEHRDLVPLFPCTRADACPMLRTSEEDWCHGTLEWEQPKLSRQFDDLLGFNKHRIKYSAFVLQRDTSLLPGYRVIIPASKGPQGIETTVCGPDFYGVVRIRKGERSDHNRPLEKARTYDRVEVSDAPRFAMAQTTVRNAGPL